MSQTKYEVIFDAKTSSLWAQWHCPICGSTMSSGEWFADVREAILECNSGMLAHLAKVHPAKPNAEERVRDWLLGQSMSMLEDGRATYTAWVRFSDGSKLPVQRTIPDDIRKLLTCDENDGFVNIYRVSANAS
jgi:hypothetical protein